MAPDEWKLAELCKEASREQRLRQRPEVVWGKVSTNTGSPALLIVRGLTLQESA